MSAFLRSSFCGFFHPFCHSKFVIFHNLQSKCHLCYRLRRDVACSCRRSQINIDVRGVRGWLVERLPRTRPSLHCFLCICMYMFLPPAYHVRRLSKEGKKKIKFTPRLHSQDERAQNHFAYFC